MYKSVELGRAVLSTSTTNLELWLKTLITVSPEQECTNLGQQLEQHTATSLLDRLSSGEVWVGCGNGLHIELMITFGGQPLADEQLRQLSECILVAPVWEQLKLRPWLPNDSVYEPGKLRFAVSHSNVRVASETKPRHRVLSDASAADLRPPADVPFFLLDSVHLSMDIYELAQQRKTTTAKRLKTSTDSSSILQPATSQKVPDLEQETFDDCLHPAHSTDVLCTVSSPMKRCRSPDSPAEATSDCRLIACASNRQIRTANPGTNTSIANLQALIDGALRLSVVSSVNNRIVPGIKIKASTFGPGLADVAPILWRPGYLFSLSQRANCIPIVSRSLQQPAATGKITSASLRRKLSVLTAPLPSSRTLNQLQYLEPAEYLCHTPLASHSASRLWLHLQKNTSCKSTTPLHAFVSAQPQPTIHFRSEDMLEDLEHENRKGQKSRPSAVEFDGGGGSNVDQVLEDHPVTSAAFEGPLSEQHLLRVVAIPDRIIEVANDDILLGDECFEPLGSGLWPIAAMEP